MNNSPIRMNSALANDGEIQPQFEGNAIPMDVGHKMVKAGKATHPHWRGSHGNKHSKRMYNNAMIAHAHTAVKP